MVGIAFTGCNSLDLEPISSIADNKYWQTEAQVDALMWGYILSLERNVVIAFFFLENLVRIIIWRVNIW